MQKRTFVSEMRTVIAVIFSMMVVLASAQTKYQYAKPREGEGISAFLERHGRRGRQYYNDFMEINKNRLRGRDYLVKGVSYAIPPLRDGSRQNAAAQEEKTANKVQDGTAVGSTFDEPLFGTAQAKGKVTGNRLQGACIYVISGHGGPDPGAIGKVGKVEMHEDEYAYDVALRLARDLMQEGAVVRIIIQDAKDGIRDARYLDNSKRETCMGEAIPLNQTRRLQQRCDKINRLYEEDRKKYGYCRAIFLHIDSRSRKQQTDVFFYHREKSQDGRHLATTMRRTFKAKYDRHQPDRGFRGTVESRALYVLSHTAPVSLFVELGNIQNANDQKRFVLSSNRQALANWLTDGFADDYRAKKHD